MIAYVENSARPETWARDIGTLSLASQSFYPTDRDDLQK